MGFDIRPFRAEDEDALTALWQECGLLRPWNPPARDIAEKLKIQRELFLVLEAQNQIIGSVMAGYDGHRGSVNYLAVHPAHQGQGHGRALMEAVETRLEAMGCPKINLMVRSSNLSTLEFYDALGYEPQDCIVLGKWLLNDGAKS